jgi:membrane protein
MSLMGYLRHLRNQMQDGELQLVAGSLAYSTVLSLIPFLAVSLAILQHLGGLDGLYPQVEKMILSNFSQTAGAEGIKLIRAALSRMQFTKVGFAGALVLIFTSTRLIHDMEKGINRVWNIENRRSLAKRVFYYWLIIVSFPFVLATLVAVSSMRELTALSNQVPSSVFYGVFFFLLLFFVYKIVPQTKVPWSSALIAAAVGSVSLLAVHKTFLWSSNKVFNYGKLYGGLASIPLVLVWILLIWYAILFGATISASLDTKKLKRIRIRR